MYIPIPSPTELKKYVISYIHTHTHPYPVNAEIFVKTGTSSGNTHGGGFVCHP